MAGEGRKPRKRPRTDAAPPREDEVDATRAEDETGEGEITARDGGGAAASEIAASGEASGLPPVPTYAQVPSPLAVYGKYDSRTPVSPFINGSALVSKGGKVDSGALTAAGYCRKYNQGPGQRDGWAQGRFRDPSSKPFLDITDTISGTNARALQAAQELALPTLQSGPRLPELGVEEWGRLQNGGTLLFHPEPVPAFDAKKNNKNGDIKRRSQRLADYAQPLPLPHVRPLVSNSDDRVFDGNVTCDKHPNLPKDAAKRHLTILHSPAQIVDSTATTLQLVCANGANLLEVEVALRRLREFHVWCNRLLPLAPLRAGDHMLTNGAISIPTQVTRPGDPHKMCSTGKTAHDDKLFLYYDRLKAKLLVLFTALEKALLPLSNECRSRNNKTSPVLPGFEEFISGQLITSTLDYFPQIHRDSPVYGTSESILLGRGQGLFVIASLGVAIDLTCGPWMICFDASPNFHGVTQALSPRYFQPAPRHFSEFSKFTGGSLFRNVDRRTRLDAESSDEQDTVFATHPLFHVANHHASRFRLVFGNTRAKDANFVSRARPVLRNLFLFCLGNVGDWLATLLPATDAASGGKAEMTDSCVGESDAPTDLINLGVFFAKTARANFSLGAREEQDVFFLEVSAFLEGRTDAVALDSSFLAFLRTFFDNVARLAASPLGWQTQADDSSGTASEKTTLEDAPVRPRETTRCPWPQCSFVAKRAAKPKAREFHLAYHIIREHAMEPENLCPDCTAALATMEGLKVHLGRCSFREVDEEKDTEVLQKARRRVEQFFPFGPRFE
jgi:hypothetical protein